MGILFDQAGIVGDQQHSALVRAVVAYGVANLDEPLTRDGV